MKTLYSKSLKLLKNVSYQKPKVTFARSMQMVKLFDRHTKKDKLTIINILHDSYTETKKKFNLSDMEIFTIGKKKVVAFDENGNQKIINVETIGWRAFQL